MSMKVDQELFQAYAFYAGIVTAKMLVMSFLTARQRFRTGVFISSEDAKQPGTKVHSVITPSIALITMMLMFLTDRSSRGRGEGEESSP